ncbi:heme biosynthesis protein HemY [Bacillus methanolicus]|uniref:iron-sulfur cluster biosynthesis family protein n=1 Tax=Bacillus methanolicus TaxID=1471 RepID=UPI002380A3EB|nr:iron-sulfur cluster biosynthesis family protein [Bacillus methanolicus]MDE3839492.1 heme biosynthesis protein HemY [Bacillus methanolicus]
MEITLTDEAASKLDEKTAGKTGYLKLKYDTDGCGCAVNGVTALWFVSETDSDDEEIVTNNRSIFVEKSAKVLLDEKMKIDFLESANCFQLKSSGEIINGRMSFIDKTK